MSRFSNSEVTNLLHVDLDPDTGVQINLYNCCLHTLDPKMYKNYIIFQGTNDYGLFMISTRNPRLDWIQSSLDKRLSMLDRIQSNLGLRILEN